MMEVAWEFVTSVMSTTANEEWPPAPHLNNGQSATTHGLNRLPAHLAFAFNHDQWQHQQHRADATTSPTPQSTRAQAPMTVASTVEWCDFKFLPSRSESERAVHLVSALLDTVLRLPIPDLTLFDADDVLSACWSQVALQLAERQKATGDTTTVLLLQGEATTTMSDRTSVDCAQVDDTSTVQGATQQSAPVVRPGQLLLVHGGEVRVVSGPTWLTQTEMNDHGHRKNEHREHTQNTPSTLPFSFTSHPPLSNPIKQWVCQLISHQSSPSDPAAATTTTTTATAMAPSSLRLHLISFLGWKHTQQPLIDVALKLADEGEDDDDDDHADADVDTSDANIDPQSLTSRLSSTVLTPPSSLSDQHPLPSSDNSHSDRRRPSVSSISAISHSVRLHIQRSLFPLPLSEPELLLVVRQGSNEMHRSLEQFPSWLLRATEIMHVERIEEMLAEVGKRRSRLRKRLQQFANTIQRGGT